jgi:hypothetical protein
MHVNIRTKLNVDRMHTKEQVYICARDCYAALHARLESVKGPFFYGTTYVYLCLYAPISCCCCCCFHAAYIVQ